MNIITRIRLGLFGENNPSNFQHMLKKHIYDTSIFNYAKETEDLCQKYGFSYKKFVKWAQYESKRGVDSFEKRILNSISQKYKISQQEKEINSTISKLMESNARMQKEVDDICSKK